MADPGRRFQDFIEFLTGFICELNALAEDGAAVVVEGKRDRDALTGLGYSGPIFTKATLHSERGAATLRRVKLAIILTDLDEEGRRLAARYAEFFALRDIGDLSDPEETPPEGLAWDLPPRGESCALRAHRP